MLRVLQHIARRLQICLSQCSLSCCLLLEVLMDVMPSPEKLSHGITGSVSSVACHWVGPVSAVQQSAALVQRYEDGKSLCRAPI